MNFTLGTALGLLKVVGPAIAAAPQFVQAWKGIVQAFDSSTDRDTLDHAYSLAISDAAGAHRELQDVIQRHS